MIINILLLLVSCLGQALADYCYSSYTSNFCSYGCCGVLNDECCDYEMSSGGIAGLVIGIIIVIAVIVITIICCRRRRAFLGRPVFVPQGAGTAGITVVQTSQQQNAMCQQLPQPMAYPQYPPSAPGCYAAGPHGYPAAGPHGYPGIGQQGYPTADQKECSAMPHGQGYVGPYPGYQQPPPPPY